MFCWFWYYVISKNLYSRRLYSISNAFAMPMMFVSGVFILSKPCWILQKLAYVFPLTYLNDAMRAVMIKGQTLGDVWLDIVLLGFTLLFFLIGVKDLIGCLKVINYVKK